MYYGESAAFGLSLKGFPSCLFTGVHFSRVYLEVNVKTLWTSKSKIVNSEQEADFSLCDLNLKYTSFEVWT